MPNSSGTCTFVWHIKECHWEENGQGFELDMIQGPRGEVYQSIPILQQCDSPLNCLSVSMRR